MQILQEKKKAGNGEVGSYASWGTYIIPSETNLKQYYIKGEYTDEHFGTGKVIAPIEENEESKNDRFYVMALEDINPGTSYCWYDAADGKLEWSVFGAVLGITGRNSYNTFGLSTGYWSSSQLDTNRTYDAPFFYGTIRPGSVFSNSYVRLANTF